MKIPVGKAKLFAGVGSYFGMGLFGNINADGHTRDFDFQDNQIQRFDSGLSYAAGVELGQFNLGASYQLGLVNINQSDFRKSKNSVGSLTVGYRFNKKSK